MLKKAFKSTSKPAAPGARAKSGTAAKGGAHSVASSKSARPAASLSKKPR
jgi:hypothetical protein